MDYRNYRFSWEHFWLGILALAATLVLGFLTTAVIKAANADGKADFCYIRYNSSSNVPHFEVEAHRPWRNDVTIARMLTVEDAIKAAEATGCPLFTK